MKKYRPRIVDKALKEKLLYSGAVLIEGAKWCGKTTTGEHFAASTLYMDDPDKAKSNIELASIRPPLLLKGDNPRLIDEWQIAPQLWDTIRFEVDHRDGFGLFILTGSSTPIDRSLMHHSGIGRINRLFMRPMSLYESGESTGEVSLSALFEGDETNIEGTNKLKLEDIAYSCVRGGWPAVSSLNKEFALKPAKEYYEGLINYDIRRVDKSIKDKTKLSLIMRSLARNQGSSISNCKIASELSSTLSSPVSDELVARYIKALIDVYAVEDMPSWNPNLRSKYAIRSTPVRYFVDPSIATSSLGIGPSDLLNDLSTFGFIFETLCARDLRVYAASIDGEVYRYRDKSGLECDGVIHLRNGKYALVEFKLGGQESIDRACESLKKVERSIDTDKMKEPSFKMVLVANEPYAYKREDGIYIVPIACLKD